MGKCLCAELLLLFISIECSDCRPLWEEPSLAWWNCLGTSDHGLGLDGGRLGGLGWPLPMKGK